uniref:Uncharacterized protein n=1 Tax=Musa acuminata subsp. malaccensis TaxID=214687 RepID=A0A804IHK4_MUSAM
MSYNNLSGQIPTTLGDLCNLTKIDLSRNNIGGELTNLFYGLSTCSQGASLSSLVLKGNNLSGIIPSSMGQLSQLHKVDLSSNSLAGENKLFSKIPTWIGRNHSSLKVLRLRSNLLYGTIPENIGDLTSLQVLDLSSNKFFGSLPSSLGNFNAMVEVQNDTRPLLQDNNYTYIESSLLTTKGSMVDYTTILSLVTSIDLSNNHLSGEIPKEMTKLLGLRFLNLSNNHLTGRIPEKMGDMKQLESLDLSVNNLTGEIPSSFSAMSFLARLNLSYNNLSGKIPTSSQLSTFDSWTYVGNKDLCGTPLPDCPVYQTPPDARVKDDEKLDKLLEYTSIVVGFVVGFWLFIGSLIMKQAIRFAFFRWIDKASDWIYVQFAIWEKWQDGSALEIVDPALGGHYQQSDLLRFVQIGLLCVQEDPSDRPTMSTIVVMLDSETVSLRAPSQPAFYMGNGDKDVLAYLKLRTPQHGVTTYVSRISSTQFLLFYLILLFGPSPTVAFTWQVCSTSAVNFTANNMYESNLNLLLSSLVSNGFASDFITDTIGWIPIQVQGITKSGTIS